MTYPFPDDFVWACATASYQVEGAAAVDGRGPSIWDTFCRQPGHVANDDTGDVADDQYHRYRDDVELMAWLGLKAYRFSIAWPRVQPAGEGAWNPAGIDYYKRLVDELLAHGIAPYVTLYHWDLPQALEANYGGWRGRDTVARFADYAGRMAAELGDRVGHFFTINEFVCWTDMGYAGGPFPPGLDLPPAERNAVRHNGLLAHGSAVQAIRANAPAGVKVGLAENAQVCVPLWETADHIAASRAAMRQENAQFLTAVLEGAYTPEYLAAEGAAAPVFTDAEMAVIGSPVDFLGMNMYAPTIVRAADNARGYDVIPHPESYPRMDMPWLYIGPQITYWGPRHAKEIWGLDHVVVSENGCAAQDRLTTAGEVLDTDRLMYLRQHLISAQRATAEGWPLKGYFLWSLLDNFEWACGYQKRFGITYVNYRTLERIPKLSAQFYRQCIAAGAVV